MSFVDRRTTDPGELTIVAAQFVSFGVSSVKYLDLGAKQKIQSSAFIAL